MLTERLLSVLDRAVREAFPGRADAVLDEIERWIRVRRGEGEGPRRCLWCERGDPEARFAVIALAGEDAPRYLAPSAGSPSPYWRHEGDEDAPLVCADCLAEAERLLDPAAAGGIGRERLLADAARALRAAGDPDAEPALAALERAQASTAGPRFVAAAPCLLCGTEGPAAGTRDAALCRTCTLPLYSRVVRDPLTGSFGRRTLLLELPLRIARAARRERPLSLAMADLDWLKSYNDMHGFQEGDRALCEVAAMISAAARPADRVYRFGGEEFAILLEGADAAAARAIAEAIRARVDARDFPPGTGGRRLTLSIGLAERREGDTDATMLRACDEALARAKELGRNRVVG